MKKDDLQIFGENLEYIRKTKNLSIEKFAVEIGYDRNYLSGLKYGERNIRFQTVMKIAKKLDIAVPVLFSRSFIDDVEHREKLKFEDVHYLKIFNKNVRSIIARMGLIQAKVGKDPATTNRILQGKTLNPCVKSLSEIASSLNVSLYELLARQEDTEV